MAYNLSTLYNRINGTVGKINTLAELCKENQQFLDTWDSFFKNGAKLFENNNKMDIDDDVVNKESE